MPLAPPPFDLKDRLRKSYDAIADTYNGWAAVTNTEILLTYIDELCTLMPRLTSTGTENDETTIRVLEIGCGAGEPVLRNLLWRGGPGLRITANDLSEVQLSLARTIPGAERVTFLPGDAMDLSFADGSLAAVVVLYTFVHLPQDEQRELLSRIAHWLEPGGCLLANFAGAEMEGFVVEEWLGHKEGWMFFSGLGAEETVESVAEVGMEVLVQHIEEDTLEQFLWLIARKG